MVLMNMFDLFDCDNDGQLSRDEFNKYNLRTGEQCTSDEEWQVLTGTRWQTRAHQLHAETFDTRDGALTMKGFTQLHQMEIEESQAQLDDVWTALTAVGYDNTLSLVCRMMCARTHVHR
jgi:hypothetical protein